MVGQRTNIKRVSSFCTDSGENYAERRKKIIQESKYLGGDMEHTHLVKGLDYALLDKVGLLGFYVAFKHHIATVPACSSGTFTNVLPHRNAMQKIQDIALHPVTVYRHRPYLSLCYSLMWNVPLEYTSTRFNVLTQTRSGNPSPTFHTHQGTLNFMILIWWLSVRSSVESTVPTES